MFSLACCGPPAAIAAPHEIKVFTDELAAPGQATLEIHANKASRAGPASGLAASPWQLMPEYSYGIAPGWELSLQLPLSVPQSRLRGDGWRIELQYVAPHAAGAGFYWGLNVEYARQNSLAGERGQEFDLSPILGWRTGRWHLAANPGITHDRDTDSRHTRFSPALKASYLVDGKQSVGFEYFRSFTPVGSGTSLRRTDMLYLAWDGKLGRADINLGIGRGLSSQSDRWVIKTIVEFGF